MTVSLFEEVIALNAAALPVLYLLEVPFKVVCQVGAAKSDKMPDILE